MTVTSTVEGEKVLNTALTPAAIAVAKPPSLRPYQEEVVVGVERERAAGHRNVLAVLPTGAGKCLGRGTPILMFDGSIKMVEDVRPGDQLMGPDSESRTVLTTCTGQEMLYRVTPTKGDPYVVNESHILSLKRTGIKGNPKYPWQRKGDVVNISVRDYLSKSNTFKHTHKGWRAPASFEGVIPSEYRDMLPPYLLGVWLGDGSSRGPSITSADPEIAEWLSDFTTATGQSIRVEEMPGNASSNYHIKGSGKHFGTTRAALRKLNLFQNKHIPHFYKTAGDVERLQLLAGVLDSDGHLANGCYDVVFKSKQLIEDVAFIARSLGFAAYIKPCRKTCTNTGVTGDYFRMSISGDVRRIPTKLERHQPGPRRQTKSVTVTGIKVEPIGVGDYFGFEITGDRLFMLGDFTVTHNTVVFSEIIRRNPGPSCAIAHRQELVSQISMALNRCGVPHRIIGPRPLIKSIVAAHMQECGVTYYDANARCAVAGVNTITRRAEELAYWLPTVTLWVQDEAHHVLRSNVWGKAIDMFPNAQGLGVTATPCRADGKGLGAHADGVFTTMVIGPSMRDLIDMGYLTDYRVFCPPSDMDFTSIKAGASGDYNHKQLRGVAEKSHIVGDVVAHYQKIAPGKLGVTFAPDVDTATDIAAQFNAAGVRAEIVTAKTPDKIRRQILAQFKRRQILQLVNVDLFGEGFDLPAIEVVSMVRKTESYALYCQQFGRALRLLEGKDEAFIIDHVGNVVRHNLPDAPREWTLDRRDSRGSSKKKDDAIPLTSCQNVVCLQVYEKVLPACPYCGTPQPAPASRSAPEFVDGDLHELDPSTLAQMRGETVKSRRTVEDVRGDLMGRHVPTQGVMHQCKLHAARLDTLATLDDRMAWWAGYYRSQGASDSEIYRRFWHRFGKDWETARASKTKEAETLIGLINEDLTQWQI